MEWKFAYVEHCNYREVTRANEIYDAGWKVFPAEVPGNFEWDLQRLGILEDLYFSDNIYQAQKLEQMHVFYFCQFEIKNRKEYLHFEGIDTISDIYVNGKLVRSTDNMYLPYDVFTDYRMGTNEVLVHIKPVMLESRKTALSAGNMTQMFQYAALAVRKAQHSFGWDIMPRIVTSGLWKEVTIREQKNPGINEVFLYAKSVDCSEKTAVLQCYTNMDAEEDRIRDYSVRVTGRCGDSSFSGVCRLWHNTQQFSILAENCKFWWPKPYGEANLYEVKAELLCRDRIIDTCELTIGIRTVELVRSDVTDQDGNGSFHFEINGRKIFVLGTNWVPLDALHSQDTKRLPQALELLDDIGCNMVRCWGGNVYESDGFFRFCDERGILVWQDFSMACGVYPQGEEFANRLKEEAVFEIKRLRNHPSLALWAGDNECDESITLSQYKNKRRNPNYNVLTRGVLKMAVFEHDPSRDFLPSSPYVSEGYLQSGEDGKMPERHLWGPRDYFKGDYYRNTFCHFASEIGYHGFPSPDSLKRFLKHPEVIFEADGYPSREYAAHAVTCDDSSEGRFDRFAARIRLAVNQVEALFNHAEAAPTDLIRQSQISQAEAKKYFIEKFRIDRIRRSGIIWWNLLDGWPQVSDAVVDYYGTKKLAYSYIRRSQNPVCMMIDEPCGGTVDLILVNDLFCEQEICYTLTDVTNQRKIAEGNVTAKADSIMKVYKIPVSEQEHTMYLIEWERNGEIFRNHYYTNLKQVDYRAYRADMERCGLDAWEGFSDSAMN